MAINSPFYGMTVFCAVIDNGGFGAAAKAMGHAASHVSKEIQSLETRLGTRLINRTTRSLSLTEAGEKYYINARQIIEDALNANRQITEGSQRPSGLIKMSIPISLSQVCINDWLAEFMTSHGDIRLEVEVSERMVDIVGEGFDLVIRAGSLTDSRAIARKLGSSPACLVASPEYLEINGTPTHPDDLRHHRTIDYGNRVGAASWKFGNGNTTTSVKLLPEVKCNNAALELALAVGGIGITRLPEFMCASDIAKGNLLELLKSHFDRNIDIHAIFASRENMPVRVRLMIEFLADKFSHDPRF